MSSYKLVVVDADHLILTTTRLLERGDALRVHETFDRWLKEGGVAVLSDCLVVRGATIDLELPDDFPDDLEACSDGHPTPVAGCAACEHERRIVPHG